MPAHRRLTARAVGSSLPHRRRWLVGVVGTLGASGLILGGWGVPVSADDVGGSGHVGVWADVQGDCVKAAVRTEGDDGSANQQGDGLASAGAEASICRDDLDGVIPPDPGGSLADDVAALIAAALEAGVAGNPGGGDPSDPGGGLPGDRAGPGITTSAGGTTPGPVAIGNGGAERGAPTDGGFGVEVGESESASVATTLWPAATLPRTGGGPGTGILRLIAVLGLGSAVLSRANGRRPAAQG